MRILRNVLERCACKVDHEHACISMVCDGTNPSPSDTCQRCGPRRIPAPVHPVGETVFLTGLQSVFRPPECHDVVVDLIGRRNFDEIHRSITPIANRLDPQGWALLVVEGKVLVVMEGALALHQAEAVRAAILEGRKLKVGRVDQRAIELLPRSSPDLKCLTVMGGRAPVIDVVMFVGIEIEHARKSGDAGFGNILPRKERGLHVKNSRVARSDGKAESSRDGRAVQKGMNDNGLNARFRLFQPELTEQSEFLAF